jgi:transcriptional regulator with XRE-family HTH domain
MQDLTTRAVATKIRKIREHKNYTQYYLAVKLGITQNAYSKMELGYSNITIERVARIAGLLEVDLLDLINTDNRDLSQLNLVRENA